MWIIATWIILFLDLLFIREFDATLLFVNEKKTLFEAMKMCKKDYGARIATKQALRHANILNLDDLGKLSKFVPFNTKIWFTEFLSNTLQAGKGTLRQGQEVLWFNGADPERQLVRIDSHHYFLCYKDGEISELNDHSAIVCNDDLEPVTNSGNSFNPRTTRLVTKEKKPSETTTWRHHHSRADRNVLTARPYSSDSLIGTRNTGGPTSSDITANTGRDFISRQVNLNTAIPTEGNTSVDCTSTVEIAIFAALGLIAVISLSAMMRLIYSRRKECAASQQTYEICDLGRRAVNNQNIDCIYDLPFQVTDRPASRPYENT